MNTEQYTQPGAAGWRFDTALEATRPAMAGAAERMGGPPGGGSAAVAEVNDARETRTVEATRSDVAVRASAAMPPGGKTPAGGVPALATSNAPPLRLPGEHFAAALIFWIAGAIGLVWVAPDLARGLFPLPRVVAVTHLSTLGWITTTIQGALYQFLPVALATPIRSQRAAHLSVALYAPGVTAFVTGLLLPSYALLLAGAVTFGLGLLVFIGNLGLTLARSRQRNVTWWALVGAAVSLLMTVVLGVSLAGNLRWGYIGEDRFLAVGVHMHVALAGWVMLVIVGVSQRLLPMFLVSHGVSDRPARLALGLLGGGVALLVSLHHALTPRSTWVIAAMLIAGVLAFVTQAILHFRSSRKPTLDPGMRLVAAALGFLVGAVVLAPVVVHRGFGDPRTATAYGISLVIGGISLFVAGHYYKILPFLIWFHRFGPLVGKQPVPRVAELFAARTAGAAALLLTAGAAGLVLATLAGLASAARPAAIVFTAGGTILVIQMIGIARRRPV